MTQTPLSRSKVNLQGAWHIVAASRTACTACIYSALPAPVDWPVFCQPSRPGPLVSMHLASLWGVPTGEPQSHGFSLTNNHVHCYCDLLTLQRLGRVHVQSAWDLYGTQEQFLNRCPLIPHATTFDSSDLGGGGTRMQVDRWLKVHRLNH